MGCEYWHGYKNDFEPPIHENQVPLYGTMNFIHMAFIVLINKRDLFWGKNGQVDSLKSPRFQEQTGHFNVNLNLVRASKL